MAEAARKTSEIFNEERAATIAALSQRVFGRAPRRMAFPGGTSRSAFIVDMGGETFVFARREDRDDAQLEGIVLKSLSATGFVPGLRAVADEWVVQQFIEGERLPVALDAEPDMPRREALVENALESLLAIHEAAHTRNLQHRVPKVGTVDKWLWNRTGAAKRIAKSIGIMAPDFDRKKLVKLMDVKRDEFIKWDARPGNAMVTDQGTVWFDWEDCGRSKALDDLAFVLCDEWCTLDAAAETRLLEKLFPLFNRSLGTRRGEHYLRLFGVTHMLMRLRMATKLHARKNEWWDRDYCLAGDKVGVTAEETARLIARIRRWSDGVEEWRGLSAWLDDVCEHYGIPHS